ncbi:HlyC/CorC family transporter [Ectothiorhodospiraceae bacterium WFHF3C12]|nr:HlyC/CorC family transporter [Ectothiorhodospiraceae bacterium WFHF3C12]
MLIVQVLIVLALILLNGFFAMSELAVVSARQARLHTMADAGRLGAGSALRLAENPVRFLSAVQVGITLIGILAGAVGGSALSGPLAQWLGQFDVLDGLAEEIAFVLVVAAITYLTLIVGELLPKQLALAHAEAIACVVARPLTWFARSLSPLVAALDFSTRAGLWLLRVRPEGKTPVSDEEIHMLVRQAAEAGVVETAEERMIRGVMRLADRPVEAVMTPRPDVKWLNIRSDAATLRGQLTASPHSRLPVCDGDIDEVLGVVQAKDLLNRALAGEPLDLQAALREPPVVPESMGAMAVLDLFRDSPVHMALVVDEYGSLLGVVTTNDLSRVIFGTLAEQGTVGEKRVVERADGSWLLDGGLPVDEVAERLQVAGFGAGDGYHTLAGWLLGELGRLPETGEVILRHGWRFEVLDMDGYRIDKVLATPQPPEDGPDALQP